MHLHRDINGRELIWIIIYPLFFCILIFIQTDPNLRIASEQIKTINTDKYLQGFAIYQSKGPVPLTPGSDIISITLRL